ncbi:MAG: hypothetical protein BGO69_03095 [Bacteroidetes bacterium 46-16]|nr:MAG: hypothetical protein BGO69_03095 [Bacteroidetes bacterium 46-16]
MTAAELIRYRLYNQQVTNQSFVRPGDMVTYLGAVQAQDYNAAKWALGLRLAKATDSGIEQAFNKGEIIRTHILRPTWHFVAPADLRWMLQLTAPRIKILSKYQHSRLELDDKLFLKSNKIIAKALQAKGPLLRNDLIEALGKAKIPIGEQRFIHIMMRAELDGIVCSGPRVGKQFTYALLDERVPPSVAISRQESLAKLALKYFCSHGPASVTDFGWWSGLTMADAKEGLALVKNELVQVSCEGKIYWMSKDVASLPAPAFAIYLLPAYDEYLISYAGRNAMIDEKHFRTVATSNGIFNPVLIVRGRVAGLWKRSISRNIMDIEVNTFAPLPASSMGKLRKAIHRYEQFIGMSTALSVKN